MRPRESRQARRRRGHDRVAHARRSVAFIGIAEAFLSAHLGGSYLLMTQAELRASSMQIREGKAGIADL
jgi:hypothetical protein